VTSPTRRDFLRSAAFMPAAVAGLVDIGAAQQSGPTLSPAAGRPPGTDRFDYVLAGAGHNSLICAAYLAKAGQRVLVLEGRAMIGGGCKTAEILLPGFKEDLCSSAHSGDHCTSIEQGCRDFQARSSRAGAHQGDGARRCREDT